MGFWIFMFLMDLLIPITMIGFGKLFMHHVPDEINYVFGYRTRMSTKNRDTWRFAHEYCGKLWFIWGCVMLLISIVALLAVMGKDTDTVGSIGGWVVCIQMVPLVGSIFPTERALRKKFDKNGRRRDDRCNL